MPYDFANSEQVSTTTENPNENSLLFGMEPGANSPSMWTIGSILGAAKATIGTIKVTTTTFLANGNFEKNDNLIFAEVIVIGSGGDGANATANASTNSYAIGGGGGSGGCATKYYGAEALSTSETVTVTSSIASFKSMSANKGSNGTLTTPGVVGAGGLGGSATGGDMNITGQPGSDGLYLSVASGIILGNGAGGYGGINPYGVSGGRGGTSSNATVGQGISGDSGFVIVREYHL